MSVGGIDLVLAAPRGEDIVDIILRACRRRWPSCIFQDANEPGYRTLEDSWVWSIGTTSTEFFIYRDAEAWRLWEAEGAVPENANAMLHFLIDADPVGPSPGEMTLVCDHYDAEIRQLRDELIGAFLDLQAVPILREAAA